MLDSELLKVEKPHYMNKLNDSSFQNVVHSVSIVGKLCDMIDKKISLVRNFDFIDYTAIAKLDNDIHYDPIPEMKDYALRKGLLAEWKNNCTHYKYSIKNSIVSFGELIAFYVSIFENEVEEMYNSIFSQYHKINYRGVLKGIIAKERTMQLSRALSDLDECRVYLSTIVYEVNT
jgi:hypothetical protein